LVLLRISFKDFSKPGGSLWSANTNSRPKEYAAENLTQLLR
jgi:hypothetical protein